jgi:hypothetical protein
MKMHKEMGDKMMEDSESADTMKSEKEIPDHEVEGAAHDLMRAEMHKSNHPLMQRVHAHLTKKKNAITSIQDLRDAKKAMFTKKS